MEFPCFYSILINDLINHGIELRLVNKRSYQKCVGFFDSNRKLLVVATKDHHWFDILIHEYCHFLQYKYDYKYWNDPIFEEINIFDFSNYKGNAKRFREAYEKTCQIEIDCDRRAVQLIKKHNLDIDLDEYIRYANLYHACYQYYLKYKTYIQLDKISHLRFLFSHQNIHSLENVWKKIPELDDYFKSIT